MKYQKIAIGDIETNYVDIGPRDSIPILILHGWGSSIQSWIEVLEELEKAEKRVLMLDLPGFGKSQEPKEPWDVDDYIAHIDALLNLLDIDELILAGHSFGGQLAISFAARKDPQLKALILMSAARIMKRKKLKVQIFSKITHLGNMVFQIPILSVLQKPVRKIWYKLSGEKDYYQASRVMRNTMKNVLGKEIGDTLSSIEVPTLILWGDKDLATPLEDAYIIKERILDSQLKIFHDVDHPINIKRPHEIAHEINNFLQSKTN
jgi:pimeloyl-ACP methyl ester carboxylesterase